MSFVDILGSFLLGLLLLSGFALAVKPGSQLGAIIGQFGTSTANLISAAKS